MSVQVIRETFERAGLLSSDTDEREKLTRQDFYELGLSGAPESRERRRNLCILLGLPEGLSAPALLDAVNALYDREKFFTILKERDSLG